MASKKLKTLQEIQELTVQYQKQGKIVVFANGCFDLLHAGHTRYVQSARSLGDVLVLGLNGDESVRALKGKGRPVMNEQERVEMVVALECLDYVVVFNDLTVDHILRVLKPDVHAKGTDYTEGTVPEKATVLSYGGKVAIVGGPKDYSTSDYLQRITQKYKA